MSNYIYIEEINTYLLKSSIEYLTIKKDSVVAYLAIGNGRSNYSIRCPSPEEAEQKRDEILTALTTA